VAEADSVYGRVAKAYAAREKAILDPTKLIVVDEADRLQMASLEQLRAIFDESDLGLILIGMPGLEKRLARYPQFYSRIGFVREFRPLSQSEMRQLLLQRWMPPDLALLKVAKIDPDAIATIIRVINGNSATPPSANPNRKNPRDQFAHCTDEGGRRGSTGDVGNRPSVKQGPRVQIIKWKELRKTSGPQYSKQTVAGKVRELAPWRGDEATFASSARSTKPTAWPIAHPRLPRQQVGL
jgi:hypothetical protein